MIVNIASLTTYVIYNDNTAVKLAFFVQIHFIDLFKPQTRFFDNYIHVIDLGIFKKKFYILHTDG